MMQLTHQSSYIDTDTLTVAEADTFQIFDGVFCLYGDEGSSLPGGGAHYTCWMEEADIVTTEDLKYRHDYDEIKKEVAFWTDFEGGELDEITDAVIEDRDPDLDLGTLFNGLDAGEASWKLQNIRGKIAKHLGYKAVEMSDENGTSVLVLPGVKMTRIAHDK